VEVPAMPVRPVHHGRDGERNCVIILHYPCTIVNWPRSCALVPGQTADACTTFEQSVHRMRGQITNLRRRSEVPQSAPDSQPVGTEFCNEVSI
jgi:hypothetical protein